MYLYYNFLLLVVGIPQHIHLLLTVFLLVAPTLTSYQGATANVGGEFAPWSKGMFVVCKDDGSLLWAHPVDEDTAVGMQHVLIPVAMLHKQEPTSDDASIDDASIVHRLSLLKEEVGRLLRVGRVEIGESAEHSALSSADHNHHFGKLSIEAVVFVTCICGAACFAGTSHSIPSESASTKRVAKVATADLLHFTTVVSALYADPAFPSINTAYKKGSNRVDAFGAETQNNPVLYDRLVELWQVYFIFIL